MKKIIKISGKDYTMQSSAYTQFAYKNETGRSFLEDLKELVKLKQETDNLDMSVLDHVSELLLKISFVMIQEADPKQVNDYISFVKNIDSLYDDSNWIYELIELACSPISRQLQANK